MTKISIVISTMYATILFFGSIYILAIFDFNKSQLNTNICIYTCFILITNSIYLYYKIIINYFESKSKSTNKGK